MKHPDIDAQDQHDSVYTIAKNAIGVGWVICLDNRPVIYGIKGKREALKVAKILNKPAETTVPL